MEHAPLVLQQMDEQQLVHKLICTKKVKGERTSKTNEPVIGRTRAAVRLMELQQVEVEQVQYAAIVAFQIADTVILLLVVVVVVPI
ncbi:unnamed protein product [Onchocerca ochengi]|uniref:Transmembrane protein n=1 Tax=Onchocerca ochengi TaxID=42157 RepID=A0A182EXI7_ONCOC|nr:unnamed protein product [Onchocerca ochengi]